MNDVQKLAGAVAGLGEELSYATAQNAVLLCAVGALVQTHPAPKAFVAAFRRGWLLLGSQHSNDAFGSQASDAWADTLAVLEQACPIELGIRPPDVAEKPWGQ